VSRTASKMSELQFVLKAIDTLKVPYKDKATGEMVTPKGLHVRYTGFNDAFKDYFGKDPIPAVNALIEQGKIEGHPIKGGFLIYKKGEMPEAQSGTGGKKALAKMGLL
jgi:hypothetical protein